MESTEFSETELLRREKAPDPRIPPPRPSAALEAVVMTWLLEISQFLMGCKFPEESMAPPEAVASVALMAWAMLLVRVVSVMLSEPLMLQMPPPRA